MARFILNAEIREPHDELAMRYLARPPSIRAASSFIGPKSTAAFLSWRRTALESALSDELEVGLSMSLK